MSKRFEQLRKRLTYAVLVDDVDEKTRALEEGKAEGYFEGLTQMQVISLKTIRSDIWRTRLEVYAERAESERAARITTEKPE